MGIFHYSDRVPNYVVVLPITPLDVGVGFTVANWPLHVTAVPKFASVVEVTRLAAVLRATVRGDAAINASIGVESRFGPDRDIRVSLFADPIALDDLHLRLLAALEEECGIALEERNIRGRVIALT